MSSVIALKLDLILDKKTITEIFPVQKLVKHGTDDGKNMLQVTESKPLLVLLPS